jgi:hypothetical protein
MRVTLSQDVLGICLILSEGDLNTPLDEIAKRAEDFQESSKRHFGITGNDFRMMLIRLVWDVFPGSILDKSRHMENVTLKEVAPKILSYEDVYCNDEGEYWCGCSERHDLAAYHIRELFDGDADRYLQKLSMKKLLADYFHNYDGDGRAAEEVRNLMREAGITANILQACSSPGASS